MHIASRLESVGVAIVLCHKAHCLPAELCQVAAVDGIHIISVGVQLHRHMSTMCHTVQVFMLGREP